MEITADSCCFVSSGTGLGSGSGSACGRVGQARRSELATRTRWKTTKVFLADVVVETSWVWEGSSEEQRDSMSLKEEQEKSREEEEEGDDDVS